MVSRITRLIALLVRHDVHDKADDPESSAALWSLVAIGKRERRQFGLRRKRRKTVVPALAEVLAPNSGSTPSGRYWSLQVLHHLQDSDPRVLGPSLVRLLDPTEEPLVRCKVPGVAMHSPKEWHALASVIAREDSGYLRLVCAVALGHSARRYPPARVLIERLLARNNSFVRGEAACAARCSQRADLLPALERAYRLSPPGDEFAYARAQIEQAQFEMRDRQYY